MPLTQLNGNDLMGLRLRLPLYGAWVADCSHADPSTTPVAGARVSLTFGSQTFLGTVVRVSDLEDLSWDTLVIGGAGGLSTVLPVAQFVSPTVSIVLGDALFTAGEVLSPTVDATLLATPLASWRRPAQSLGRELDAICQQLGCSWRVLSDGTIWLGTDTWATASVQDFDTMAWDAASGTVTIASEDPTVLPGQTWANAGRIGTVIHSCTAEATRSDLWLTESADREVGTFDSLLPSPDMLAFYQYRVISQNGDGTLELKSLDSRLPDLSRVPVRFGLPGCSVTATSSQRVMVGFGSGGQSDPYVASWVTGQASVMGLEATTRLDLGSSPAADYVALAALVAGQLAAISASIVNIAAAVNAIVPGSVTVIYGVTTPIGSVAATKVKAT